MVTLRSRDVKIGYFHNCQPVFYFCICTIIVRNANLDLDNDHKSRLDITVMRRVCTMGRVTSLRQSLASKQRYRSCWRDGMASGRKFRSVTAHGANDFWHSVVLQRGTWSFCCITVPRTGLSFNSRSSLSWAPPHVRWGPYMRTSLLTCLRSSRSSSFSSCNNTVTPSHWLTGRMC